MSSRVRIVEPPAEVGVGGGEPCSIGGGGAAFTARIEVVSGPFDEVAGFGSTATPPAADADAEAAAVVAAATPGADVRRCGSRAIWASSSRTVCGRCPGSLASTLASSASSSSGRLALIFTADGIGVFTVAYATSIRLEPMYGRRPVSISNVSTPMA